MYLVSSEQKRKEKKYSMCVGWRLTRCVRSRSRSTVRSKFFMCSRVSCPIIWPCPCICVSMSPFRQCVVRLAVFVVFLLFVFVFSRLFFLFCIRPCAHASLQPLENCAFRCLVFMCGLYAELNFIDYTAPFRLRCRSFVWCCRYRWDQLPSYSPSTSPLSTPP